MNQHWSELKVFHIQASALQASLVEHHGNCPHGPAQAPFSPRRARRGVSSELNAKKKMSIAQQIEWKAKISVALKNVQVCFLLRVTGIDD